MNSPDLTNLIIDLPIPRALLAIDASGSTISLSTSPRGDERILTAIECFSCLALISNRLTQTIVPTVLESSTLFYGTPRLILTDRSCNFHISDFISFIILFRIFKTRFTTHYPDANGVCRRFDQILVFVLREMFSDFHRDPFGLFIPTTAVAYNTSMSLITGFSPFHLTSGSEVQLPLDLIVGFPSNSLLSLSKHNAPAHVSIATKGLLSLLLRSFEILSHAFASVRENLHSFQQRERFI